MPMPIILVKSNLLCNDMTPSRSTPKPLSIAMLMLVNLPDQSVGSSYLILKRERKTTISNVLNREFTTSKPYFAALHNTLDRTTSHLVLQWVAQT
eukprot:5782467-Amphidinium_carterae.1